MTCQVCLTHFSFLAQTSPLEGRFAPFGPCAGTLVDDSLALRSASPEPLIPKPIAPDRSSLMRSSCFLRSSRWSVLARLLFDEPSAPRSVPSTSPRPRVRHALPSLRVPNPEPRVQLFFGNPEPRLTGPKRAEKNYTVPKVGYQEEYFADRYPGPPIPCSLFPVPYR